MLSWILNPTVGVLALIGWLVLVVWLGLSIARMLMEDQDSEEDA